MRFDKKLYICVASFLSALLLVSLIRDKIAQNIALGIFLPISALLLCRLLKKRGAHDFHKRQVAWIMAMVAVLLLVLFFLTGIAFGFAGAARHPALLQGFILPYGLSIVSMEILRSVLLAQKSRPVVALSFLSFAWIDFLILCDTNMFANYDRFIAALGLALLPALTSGILYHNLAVRFGALPNIVYKLIIFLFPYAIPYEPQLSAALLSFSRILLPIGILMLIRALYIPKRFVVARHKSLVHAIAMSLATVLSTCYIMLISQQFPYQLLVVATDSMAGSIDRGDAIIFEEYRGHTIEAGDVIVFTKDESKIIHRVMDIKQINGERRYFTKGDANQGMDSGYVTDSHIVGVLRLKIKHVGYPTIWIRSLF